MSAKLSRPWFWPFYWEGPKYMTSKEASAYLGFKGRTIDNHVQAWRISRGRIGLRKEGRTYFLPADVLDFRRRRIAEEYVRKIYRAISNLAAKRKAKLAPVRFFFACPVAVEAHREDKRFFGHSYHTAWAGRWGICLVPEIATLPPPKAAGIVLHEIGHTMSQDRDLLTTEASADAWPKQALGIDILYDPEDTLEYLDSKAMKALKLA